jgi:hypothetical protein
MATYFTNDFELNKCGSSDKPFIVSWDQTNSVENFVSTCTGSITNVTISGGTPPYILKVRYPDGTLGRAGNNFTNLCAGQYTATTQDASLSSTTSFITILPLTAGTLTAGIEDDSCLYNINQFCSIRVSGFTHTSDNFTYLLYKDTNLYDSYIGKTGEESHLFSNLTHGNYTITAYDGNSSSYKSEKTELCTCLNGYTLDSSVVYKKVTNTFTGLTPSDIVGDWRRFNVFNNHRIVFRTGVGPHTLPPFNSNPDAIVFETGLKPDGTFNSDDPYTWFYTGETSTRKTENTVDWYLGEYNLDMEDGDNVGPAGYTTTADVGKFYFNTVINKFVVRYEVANTINTWFTINATQNRGQNVLPISTAGRGAYILTGSSAYQSVSVPSTANMGYTPTGTTMDVVQWNNLVSTSDAGVILNTNSNKTVLLASTCKYLNYVHQMSLGSQSADDDSIGVILATFIDSDGLYGPPGIPHMLSLKFNNAGLSSSAVNIEFNSNENEVYAFRQEGRRTVNCGYETPQGCTSTSVDYPITGYSTTILKNNYDKSPFTQNDYNVQGTTFLRIERSGNLGEKFNIKMTDALVAADVGTATSFNSDYEIDFNLLDKSTWVGNDASAPYFAEEKDLYRFLGSQSIGYLQRSQPDSLFYNISFTGTQSNYNFTSLAYGGSSTEQFELGLPDLSGVDMSTDTTTDFYNSIGGGGEIGNPTIPRIRPRPTVSMQTTQIPIVKTSGATKISDSTDKYVIYDNDNLEVGKEEPCVEFNFEWTRNTTDLLNNNMIPYYSIHPYIPEQRAFNPTPSITRIFDNPRGRQFIEAEDKEVIGEGITITDCIKLSQIGSGSEFIIKPNYIIKDKLENMETTPCNVIMESVTGMTTGLTKTDRWYDTFDPNPDFKVVGNTDSTGILNWGVDGKIYTREYGLYDESTDFYFLRKPPSVAANLETNDILYGINNSCGKLTSQQIVVSPASGTTGTTLSPLVVSGQPYTVTLDFPAAGPLQVILNGLTLFASQEEDFSDGGDYYFDGNSQLKFKPDTVQGYDLINLIYVPGTFERSYYYDSYIVPSSIPNVSGGTSVTGNTLYTNGYYYFFQTTYTPIGDVGITLNGTVLSPNSDFKLIKNNTIQFTGIQYPDGLTENDIIGQFYFTKFNLLGAAGTKNPSINVTVPPSFYYVYELLLIVRDESGVIVYTEKQVCKPNENSTIDQIVNSGSERIRGVEKTFTVEVPEPGKYSYNIVTKTIYTLINGETISNSYSSESYSFSISDAVFYDESGDNEINITPSSTY